MPDGNLKEDIGTIRKAAVEFSRSFTDLAKIIENLENRIIVLESGTSKSHEQQSVQNTSEAEENCLYFANGVKGVFLQANGTPEFQDRTSLYCFEKINENEASVSIVNEISVVNKIRRNSDPLDGVCEQLNQCGENTKGIETVVPGKAVLEGDKWRITAVTKIRYI